MGTVDDIRQKQHNGSREEDIKTATQIDMQPV